MYRPLTSKFMVRAAVLVAGLAVPSHALMADDTDQAQTNGQDIEITVESATPAGDAPAEAPKQDSGDKGNADDSGGDDNSGSRKSNDVPAPAPATQGQDKSFTALAADAAPDHVTVVEDGPKTTITGDAGAGGQDGASIDDQSLSLPEADGTTQVHIQAGNGADTFDPDTNATNGGDTGHVIVEIDGGYTDTVEVINKAGDGGNALGQNSDAGHGGQAGGIDATITGKANVTLENHGGKGGIAPNGEKGDAGGTGKTTVKVVDGADAGVVIVRDIAGESGFLGTGDTPASSGGVDFTVEKGARVDTIYIETAGTASTGPDAPGGQSGDINLTLQGKVNNASLNTGSNGAVAGKVKVTLGEGAELTGTISNLSSATGTLVFNMAVSSSGKASASKSIADARISNSGTVIIDGKSYRFENFNELIDLLEEKPNVDPDPDPGSSSEEPGSSSSSSEEPDNTSSSSEEPDNSSSSEEPGSSSSSEEPNSSSSSSSEQPGASSSSEEPDGGNPDEPEGPDIEIIFDNAPFPESMGTVSAAGPQPAPSPDGEKNVCSRGPGVKPGQWVEITTYPDSAQIEVFYHRNAHFTLGTIANNAFVGTDGSLLLGPDNKPLPTLAAGWKADIQGFRNGQIVTYVYGPSSKGYAATVPAWICKGPKAL